MFSYEDRLRAVQGRFFDHECVHEAQKVMEVRAVLKRIGCHICGMSARSSAGGFTCASKVEQLSGDCGHRCATSVAVAPRRLGAAAHGGFCD